MKQLDFFLLNHRIFLVKNFYQFNGDCLCVKTKYESKYKKESPIFSSDVLMEIVSLFEQTGSVFKPLEAPCDQIEQVYVKVESPEELPAREIEDCDYLQSPVQDSTQINPFYDSGSDIADSSQENTSSAETLSNEEYPLTPSFGNSIQMRKKEIPEWWENPDDSLEAEDLKWNQESKTLQYSCPAENCQKTFKSWASLTLHRISHPEDRGKIHKCKKCDKIFLEKYALKRHFRRKHLTVRFKCNKCKCKFREEKNYRNHLEEHEMEPGEPEVFDEPVNSPEFKEPVASVKPRKLSDAYGCPICSEGFRQEHFLALHMMTHEMPKKPKKLEKPKMPKLPKKDFLCEECGKVSVNAKNHEKHQRIHTRDYPYRCDVCGKGVIWLTAFRKHMAKHEGRLPNRPTSMCEICGRNLCNEITLQRHIQRIHLRPQKEFKCNIVECGRSYPNEKSLHRHMDRHKGKLFKCSSCDVEYKDKAQLGVHMERVHLKREARYKCEKCGKQSWQINCHRKHMRLHHRIELPYVRKRQAGGEGK